MMAENIGPKVHYSSDTSSIGSLGTRLSRYVDELVNSLRKEGFSIDDSYSSPLSDEQIAQGVEARVVAQARRTGNELVPNPLHPANRGPCISASNGKDPFAQLNRGIRQIGAFFDEYSTGRYDPTPD